jgi:CheY-like chemotaxis protein
MPQIPHLLHIDDSEDDRLIFARAFAKSGLSGVLHSVSNASDALLYLNRLGPYADAPRPRLILLDLSLPRLDGREFLEVLKKNHRFRTISLIVLSGSENFKDMQRSRELGIDDYVVKPKTNQELIELIASFGHWLIGSSSGIPKNT